MRQTAALIVFVLQVAASAAVPPLSFDDILRKLRNLEGNDLRSAIWELARQAPELGLEDVQIDSVIEELKRIEDSDPFRIHQGTKGSTPENPGPLVYVNRQVAAYANRVFQFRKVMNDLGSLPFDQQLGALFESIEGRGSTFAPATHERGWYCAELRRLGSPAVPHIIERAEKADNFRTVYGHILADIGDPRAVEFMVRSLHEVEASDTSGRCDWLRLLSSFDHPSAIEALVQSMQDRSRRTRDARLMARQQMSKVGAIADDPIKYYPVRACALDGLKRLTDLDWGPIFESDPKTWQAWLEAGGDEINPTTLPRTDSEVFDLLESFVFKAMRRGEPKQGWISPEDACEMQSLGPDVPRVLLSVYRTIVSEFPVWEAHLGRWVANLLAAVGTPEALLAANELDYSNPQLRLP